MAQATSAHHTAPTKVRIGVIGHGVVGSAFTDLVERQRPTGPGDVRLEPLGERSRPDPDDVLPWCSHEQETLTGPLATATPVAFRP